MGARRGVILLIAACSVVILSAGLVRGADRISSTSYVIDASALGTNGGGNISSTNYKLTSTAGETVIGNASGGSYKMGMGFISQLDKSLTLTVQPNGLVAYYPLNENSGSATYDNSVGLHDGSLQGTPIWVAGKVGSALSFNGSSQYVALPDFDVAGSAITVSAWVYPTVASEDSKVLGKHSSTTDAQGTLGITGGNASFETTTGGTYHIATATSALPINTWSYIAGVYDGANTKIYVNGVPAATPVASTGALATNALGWAIGRLSASGASNYFTGYIDEAKIFSVALNDDDVLAEYSAVTAGVTSGISLGTIIPGASKTILADVITRTDAGGYALAISQDHDLTNGSYTIPPISASIAAPATWTEGSTKGLGFTLTATNATTLPGSWGAGSSYAAFPLSPTSFYTRTGQQSTTDYLTIRVRADADTTQASTVTPYTNTFTVT